MLRYVATEIADNQTIRRSTVFSRSEYVNPHEKSVYLYIKTYCFEFQKNKVLTNDFTNQESTIQTNKKEKKVKKQHYTKQRSSRFV